MKTIKIDPEIHKQLKVNALDRDMKLNKYLEYVAWRDEAGVVFDVEKYSEDDLTAVKSDIENELLKRANETEEYLTKKAELEAKLSEIATEHLGLKTTITVK